MECTLVIDQHLLDEARQVTGTAEVQDLVAMGLRELVRQRRLDAFAARFGTYSIETTPEELRRLRRAELVRLGEQ